MSFVCVYVCVSVGSVTVISPLELIRTKLQSEKQSYRQLSAVIRSSVHSEGLRSLWRGWGPTLLRDVPFSGDSYTNRHIANGGWVKTTYEGIFSTAMYWYNYEKGKSWLCDYYSSDPTFAITFTAGAVSGSVSLCDVSQELFIAVICWCK